MQQRPLGRSGLAVSRLGLGTMTWGRDTDEHEAADQLSSWPGTELTGFDNPVWSVVGIVLGLGFVLMSMSMRKPRRLIPREWDEPFDRSSRRRGPRLRASGRAVRIVPIAAAAAFLLPATLLPTALLPSPAAAKPAHSPMQFFEGRTEGVSTVKVMTRKAYRSRTTGRASRTIGRMSWRSSGVVSIASGRTASLAGASALAAGRSLDRYGQPMTIKLKGEVEPFFQDAEAEAPGEPPQAPETPADAE